MRSARGSKDHHKGLDFGIILREDACGEIHGKAKGAFGKAKNVSESVLLGIPEVQSPWDHFDCRNK